MALETKKTIPISWTYYLSSSKLSVVWLSVVRLSVVRLSVVRLSVVRLSVVILNVVAPSIRIFWAEHLRYQCLLFFCFTCLMLTTKASQKVFRILAAWHFVKWHLAYRHWVYNLICSCLTLTHNTHAQAHTHTRPNLHQTHLPTIVGKMTFSIMTLSKMILKIMTHSINGTQQNDTQHRDTQHKDTQHNDTQHNDTQHNDTQHNDTKNNDT
jgi:hypothetical protein